jgi:hypothetical protein
LISLAYQTSLKDIFEQKRRAEHTARITRRRPFA